MSSIDAALLELFQEEARTQTVLLTELLLRLEGEEGNSEHISALMRAAHSLKGAARIVERPVVVRLAHGLEDWFVGAQRRQSIVESGQVDVLFSAVDLLGECAALPDDEFSNWSLTHEGRVQGVIHALATLDRATALPGVTDLRATRGAAGTDVHDSDHPAHDSRPSRSGGDDESPADPTGTPLSAPVESTTLPASRERLLGLTSEALVASHQLATLSRESRDYRQAQRAIAEALDQLRASLAGTPLSDRTRHALAALQRQTLDRREVRQKRDLETEAVSQRLADVVGHLYHEVLDSRMRPFEEGTVAFPRMVRDIARDLGKEARLVVHGGVTPVDREVLRRLDVPLVHLLRNAVDHGVGFPEDRRREGKPERGTITVTARHGGGRLLVTVEDDGRGIDVEAVREAVVRKRHVDAPSAALMHERELLEFLFLPGFSLRDDVTELSGRGVGLDAVRTVVHEIGGVIRVSTTAGKGTRFEMQLPLTLSVVRALIAEVGGQACAIPLARIRCVLRLSRTRVDSVEGRQHFPLGTRQVGLFWAHEVLGLASPAVESDATAVIVLDDDDLSYGIAVDRLVGEQEIVLRGLDPQLGKVPNVGAAAVLPNGTAVLVLDVDDVVRSIANLLSGGRLDAVRRASDRAAVRKRVLIADDSMTVRELERKLIAARGYDVDVAVDGMDAWNAIRASNYDLLLTDVDMPRLDGIELVQLVRNDPSLRSTPIVIVSYKDREEDRKRGLEAGADHYLTKASFYDETMLSAIEDLIGGANA